MRRGQLKRRERPVLIATGQRTHGLCPEIEAFYASINRIRERVMLKTPWRHVPGWNGKDS